MVIVITISASGARNIHVMIKFLLIILTDMPKEIIHHGKLFDLLARVGAFIREVSTLVRDLEEKSRNEENSYQCCFPMIDGPLFMYLLLIHLNDLLDSNSFSIALVKEEIRPVKEVFKFLRSFFAKDVIDSIIVRDNGLLHLIFFTSLHKKIRLIKEEVSNISEKIPKNKSLVVVNSTKNPVERKSLTTGKIIVVFKEETNWLISKLTSGPKDLDVISITGMPDSDKTTLAYKLYNDESVCIHFDLHAWCTVDQEYDKKKVLMKLFNQVTGLDLKYLIVLDDVWDIDTWDELTRPFPKVVNGSRIILTTRQKEVAFHGKCNTDPLNLRLLSSEESWELLEKRAFGKESFPDELLDVGKEIALNCKGLPLVVDLIAGVIAGREKTKSVWLEVRKQFEFLYFEQ
ncbi:hypothetical protein P3S67_011134 [Capsicum chacoense]